MKRLRVIAGFILLIFFHSLLFAETAVDSEGKMLVLLGHYKNGAGEDIPSNIAKDFIKDFVENNSDYSADIFGWYTAKNRTQNESECIAQISASKAAKQQAFDEYVALHKEHWSSDAQEVPADAEYISASSLGTENPFSIVTNPEAVYTKIGDYAYGPGYFQKMDILLPKGFGQPGFKADSVLFYIHGGGWKFGDKLMPYEFSPVFADHIGRTNTIVISVNYRSYPEVTVEGELEDVSNGVKTGIALLNEQNIELPINISGPSAGGYFTSMLLTAPTLLDEYYSQIGAGFAVAPGSHVKKYLAKTTLAELPGIHESAWEDVVDILSTSVTEEVDPFAQAKNIDTSKHLYIYQGALDGLVLQKYTDEYVTMLPEGSYTYQVFPNSTHASEEFSEMLFGKEKLEEVVAAFKENMETDPTFAALNNFIAKGRAHKEVFSNCLMTDSLGDAFYTAAGEIMNLKIASDSEFNLGEYSKYLMLILTDEGPSGEIIYDARYNVTKYFLSVQNFEAELETLKNSLK